MYLKGWDFAQIKPITPPFRASMYNMIRWANGPMPCWILTAKSRLVGNMAYFSPLCQLMSPLVDLFISYLIRAGGPRHADGHQALGCRSLCGLWLAAGSRQATRWSGK